MHAIIMAGGRGTRLLPLTADRPKALVEVGGMPILEILARQLVRYRFQRLTLCVSHLSGLIQDRFGDGAGFGIEIDYCQDTRPRGTAGPLALVPRWDTPALVMNCDLLTALDFRAPFLSHERDGAALTVVARRDVVSLPTGVLDFAPDGTIRGVWEKPDLTLDNVAGIYIVDPGVRKLMPDSEPLGMPELISRVCADGQTVVAHTFTDAWHDIGSPAQLEEARRAFLSEPELYLGSREPRPAPCAVYTHGQDPREDRELAGAHSAVRIRPSGPDGAARLRVARAGADHVGEAL